MGLLNLHRLNPDALHREQGFRHYVLAQIKEKKMPIRISMSHTAGNSYLFGKWILEEYGINQQDITAWGGKIYTPSTNDAASMMKDGQLDVALWIGPGEAFIVQDMMNSVDLDILPVDENVIKAVGEKYGLQRDVIPASFYGGKFGKDIVTVSASTELMINKNVSEDIAYKMVKAMCEKRDDIVIASPFWKSFMPEKAGQGLALPLHPGAAKYYKEKGWL
ncbi:MAG: TAXI family TRAP transporter solute-binding subunit [Bilophila wadsworthia]